ncbi:hypothetical protein DX908_13605 [Parvularcula marina]|uniref:Uncharacterized protein n=2 Tax=Parvularcula marina TaxID=2292771 RepID=A0A371RL65_9PROT|nr:hypothetical protein DX908_13605 [Parvularcula marina]
MSMDYDSILKLEKLRAEEAAVEECLVTEYRRLTLEDREIGLRLNRNIWRTYDHMISEGMATPGLLLSLARNEYSARQCHPDLASLSLEESFSICLQFYAELWDK